MKDMTIKCDLCGYKTNDSYDYVSLADQARPMGISRLRGKDEDEVLIVEQGTLEGKKDVCTNCLQEMYDVTTGKKEEMVTIGEYEPELLLGKLIEKNGGCMTISEVELRFLRRDMLGKTIEKFPDEERRQYVLAVTGGDRDEETNNQDR